MKKAYICYLVTPDRQGFLLIGSGYTEDEAIKDAEKEIEQDGLTMEEGSTLECDEVEMKDGESLIDTVNRYL